MPDMNFSDVLELPEFIDTITVQTLLKTIGNDGVSVDGSSTTTATTAVVVPGKSSLRRADDGTRVDAYIDVYTQFMLSSGGRVTDAEERAADVVTWHGRDYAVIAVEDYSAFGAGFIHASCDLLPLNPSA